MNKKFKVKLNTLINQMKDFKIKLKRRKKIIIKITELIKVNTKINFYNKEKLTLKKLNLMDGM